MEIQSFSAEFNNRRRPFRRDVSLGVIAVGIAGLCLGAVIYAKVQRDQAFADVAVPTQCKLVDLVASEQTCFRGAHRETVGTAYECFHVSGVYSYNDDSNRATLDWNLFYDLGDFSLESALSDAIAQRGVNRTTNECSFDPSFPENVNIKYSVEEIHERLKSDKRVAISVLVIGGTLSALGVAGLLLGK